MINLAKGDDGFLKRRGAGFGNWEQLAKFRSDTSRSCADKVRSWSCAILLAFAMLALFSSAAGFQMGAPKAPARTMVPRMIATAPPVELAKPAPTATKPWEVHKFGGASLATAALYKECSDLLITEANREGAPTMAIVSAKGGVTDRLVEVVSAEHGAESAVKFGGSGDACGDVPPRSSSA